MSKLHYIIFVIVFLCMTIPTMIISITYMVEYTGVNYCENVVEIVEEDHTIVDISCVSGSFGKHIKPNCNFYYSITIETGEILETTLNNLVCDSIYRFRIHGYANDNKICRYISSAIVI